MGGLLLERSLSLPWRPLAGSMMLVYRPGATRRKMENSPTCPVYLECWSSSSLQQLLFIFKVLKELPYEFYLAAIVAFSGGARWMWSLHFTLAVLGASMRELMVFVESSSSPASVTTTPNPTLEANLSLFIPCNTFAHPSLWLTVIVCMFSSCHLFKGQ